MIIVRRVGDGDHCRALDYVARTMNAANKYRDALWRPRNTSLTYAGRSRIALTLLLKWSLISSTSAP